GRDHGPILDAYHEGCVAEHDERILSPLLRYAVHGTGQFLQVTLREADPPGGEPLLGMLGKLETLGGQLLVQHPGKGFAAWTGGWCRLGPRRLRGGYLD